MQKQKTNRTDCRILLVEDQHLDAEAMEEELQAAIPKVTILRIETESEFIGRRAKIIHFAPHAAIIDMLLAWAPVSPNAPQRPKHADHRTAGCRVVQALRTGGHTKTFPIIVYSHLGHDAIRERFGTLPKDVIPQDKDARKVAGLVKSLLTASGVLDQDDGPPAFRNRIFISYSHLDREWVDRLQVFLKPYGKKLAVWDDSQLMSGKWRPQIEEQMATCGAALFLMTSNFCASGFILGTELPKMLRRYNSGGVRVFWIAVEPAAVHKTPLLKFQCLNDPKRPLSGMTTNDRKETLVKIAKQIDTEMGAPPAVIRRGS